MKYLVTIPTYNEQENIGVLLTKINNLALADLDILMIDDNSPDQTGALVKSWQKSQTNLFLLARPEKSGLGEAYQAGFAWGLKHGYDVLIQMDADLSHDPSYLSLMIPKIKTVDFVVGSRYCRGGLVENWGIVRRLLSIGGNFYARFVLGVKMADLTGGFNAWRSRYKENRLGTDCRKRLCFSD